MRNVSLWLSTCSTLLLISCDSGGRFEIKNNTTGFIDSLYITPDKNSGQNYIALDAGEKKILNTDMSNLGVDGTFILNYKTSYGPKFIQFGYYSNGAFMEKIIRIDIQPDTVLFEFEYSNY